MFDRIQTTLAAIRAKLLNNAVIRKLLYNDSNNALNLDTPETSLVDKYITLYPIFEFENKADYTQNSMINIVLTDAKPNEDEVGVTGVLQISVVVNIDKWTLIENKIRPLELVTEIIKALDNQKFTVSNTLHLHSIQQLVLSKQLVGYALLFEITDGSGKLNNY